MQHNQPTPSDYIYKEKPYYLTINNKIQQGYNLPTQTLRCITSVERIKVAKFELTDSNVLKTPFPFGCPYKWCSQPQDSNKFVRPTLPYSGWLSRLQNYEKKQYKQRKTQKSLEDRIKKPNFAVSKYRFWLSG